MSSLRAHTWARRQQLVCARRCLVRCAAKHSGVVAQNIANIVWAAGTLRLQLDSAEEQLLLQQLQKHSRRLSAQQVSNAWLGLAHLGLQPGAHLAAGLQDAVAHVAGAMNGQEVAKHAMGVCQAQATDP